LLDEGKKKEPRIENIDDNLNLGLRSDAFDKGRKSGTGDSQKGTPGKKLDLIKNDEDEENDSNESDDGNKVG
jgi:hypothetical protein